MGWPRRVSLKAGKKETLKLLMFPGKTHEENYTFLVCTEKICFACFLIFRFPLYIFALNLLFKILAFIFYLNYWIFCSCDHPDANFTTVSFFHLLILLCWNQNKINMSFRLLQYRSYIALLFFLKWFWEVFKTYIFFKNIFVYISSNPTLSYFQSHFSLLIFALA